MFVRITINGERKGFSANREALLAHWDAKAQKMKGNSSEAVNINTHIEAIKTALNRHHSRLVTLGKTVTSQMLKNEYLGIDKTIALRKIYQRIRDVRQKDASYDTLPDCWKTLQHQHAEDWPAPLEILEILIQKNIFEETANDIHQYLETKAANEKAFTKLINDGFKLIKKISFSLSYLIPPAADILYN